MYFDELDLNDYVLDALDDMQFETCTPIQESCIPHILAGRDILGVAQTGTGKTAAYLLPILSKLADGGYPADAINCVIMSPTRELAQQIDQAMQGFAYHLDGVSSVAVYGGNDGNRYDQELKSLSLGADVVIATPGRFISHMSLGNVDLSRVSFFILDEADRMLDMGFSEDILTIARKLPQNVQTIMFSATMPDKIEDLAKTLLKNPVEVKLAVSKPAEKIQQKAYVCYETQKMAILKDIFKAGDLNRVIIFSGSKQKVKQIAASLKRMKVNCGEMHSDLDQAERDEMMFQFKSGQLDVIVATDIISRGIDIDDIAMVVNFDVPRDAEDYQCIFARNEGAVVAPAAGLHFTRSLITRLKIKGVHDAYITVHCGLGTFREIDVEDLTKHRMDSEQVLADEKLVETVNEAKDGNHRVCAVGTATLRAITSAESMGGHMMPFDGWTNKFIFPPYDFNVCSDLITNFHLPYSTLLMMVSAFGGYDLVHHAYEVAVKEGYRFGCFGDAMLII